MEGFERPPRVGASRPAVLLGQWRSALAELEAVSTGIVERAEIDAVMTAVQRYVRGRGDLLTARIGPHRPVDPLAEVAGRAADLEYEGRPDLAETVLDVYRRQSGDGFAPSLAHFYRAQRAATRSGAAGRRAAESQEVDGPEAAGARRLFDMARRHLEAATVRLVLIGGRPGTGKTTLAGDIRAATGWPVISSDLLHRRMAGLDPGDDPHGSFGAGLYAPDATATVYSELLEEAAALLRSGYSVVLDAAWTHRSWRDAARDVAERTAADLVGIQCEPGLELTRGGSHRDGPSSSATTLAEAMSAAMEPWLEAAALDTSGDYTETVFVALGIIGVAPEAIAPEFNRRGGAVR